MVVDDLPPVHGHHGLLAVVGSRLAAGAGKVASDLRPLFFVKGQRIAEGLGHGLLRQVVLGGAKPAGKNQQVAAAFGLQNQLLQPGGVIADDMLVQHADAQLGQLAA